MKRASYRHAVAWIAENDDAGSADAVLVEHVASYISTLLVADIFGLDEYRVARDVVRRRTKNQARS